MDAGRQNERFVTVGSRGQRARAKTQMAFGPNVRRVDPALKKAVSPVWIGRHDVDGAGIESRSQSLLVRARSDFMNFNQLLNPGVTWPVIWIMLTIFVLSAGDSKYVRLRDEHVCPLVRS